MPRPNRQDERRQELLPILARTFADHGYAGCTTAALAEATQLRENQLYRLWPSKKAMFLAVIDYLYDMQAQWWDSVIAEKSPTEALQYILEEEGKHRGESGLHRITFAGLSEARDPDIREALIAMYTRFHAYITDTLKRQAKASGNKPDFTPALAAWSLIALGSFASIARELDLFPIATQHKLISQLGGELASIPRGKTKR